MREARSSKPDDGPATPPLAGGHRGVDGVIVLMEHLLARRTVRSNV